MDSPTCQQCGGPVSTNKAKKCKICASTKLPDPTAEEIEERAAEIRESWDRLRWSKALPEPPPVEIVEVGVMVGRREPGGDY